MGEQHYRNSFSKVLVIPLYRVFLTRSVFSNRRPFDPAPSLMSFPDITCALCVLDGAANARRYVDSCCGWFAASACRGRADRGGAAKDWFRPGKASQAQVGVCAGKDLCSHRQVISASIRRATCAMAAVVRHRKHRQDRPSRGASLATVGLFGAEDRDL